MTYLGGPPLNKLQFYLTSAYPCSYLSGRQARSQVATPAQLIDGAVYGELLRSGFRRSGLFTYRPRCDSCRECVPVRLPVAAFRPSRTQRRIWRRNRDLVAQLHPLRFNPAHFELYRRYQSARHSGGGMDRDSPEQFIHFLLKSNVESLLIEFRLDDVPVMVSLVDKTPVGLSSVYTFFEPSLERRSLGVFNVLWQIGLARKLDVGYLYLGYWINNCRKMAYKTNYRPLEALIDGTWRLYQPTPVQA
jgi:arginine-tRNA-protein transferase